MVHGAWRVQSPTAGSSDTCPTILTLTVAPTMTQLEAGAPCCPPQLNAATIGSKNACHVATMLLHKLHNLTNVCRKLFLQCVFWLLYKKESPYSLKALLLLGNQPVYYLNNLFDRRFLSL